MARKLFELDGIAGSQTRDNQNEILDIEGADLSEVLNGRGRFNDNHGSNFFSSLGYITKAKKIFKADDCEDERHQYYWDKVKAPFIYVRGYLYDDDDHPNAKAAAAILRNIHKNDIPLRIKASVEGGVVARSPKDPTVLARTKIHSVALTFTPANSSTLIEPLNLDKTASDEIRDRELIASVMHLAKADIPSFRHITRSISAIRILENLELINEQLVKCGQEPVLLGVTEDELIASALMEKIEENVEKIHALVKALTVGYGYSGAPTSMTGGCVLTSESLDKPKKHLICKACGKEQLHTPYQTKCRHCQKSFDLSDIARMWS